MLLDCVIYLTMCSQLQAGDKVSHGEYLVLLSAHPLSLAGA